MKNNTVSLHDGMDVSLCSYDKETQILQYSGAVNPLFIFREGEILEFKGSMWSIDKNNNTEFTSIDIQTHKGDIVYMFSDGYQDQFGGPKSKRIMKKGLKKLFIEIGNLPLNQQKDYLYNYLIDWKKDEEQIDDITIFGVKL